MSLPAGDKRPKMLTSSNGTTTLPFSDACGRWQRASIVSYLGSVLLFVTASSAGLATNVLQMPSLGKRLDPTFRINVLVLMADTLTPLEKNTVLIGLESSILANRLLWIGVALAMLAFTHVRFRFSHRAA